MFENAASVGLLYVGERSPEQRAAHEWCGAAAVAADPVDLAGIDDPGLARYDVLWWHRTEPVGAVDPDAREAIRSYLRDGGGLLLSLQALTAVPGLGIDPVGPDAVGVEDPAEPIGYLAKRLHVDHPVFEGFDDLRIHTADPGEQPYARYVEVLPERGEVLAALVHGPDDAVRDLPLVSWNEGEGRVIGAGSALTFDDPIEEGAATARSRLVGNLLDVLAGGAVPIRPHSGDELAAFRERVAEPARPAYHLTPPANWLNDPNGLIRWNGRYHVFYQYNPAGPMHGTIHWGHATSEDLVHWEDEPVALSPSPDGPDRDGCWSGCAIDDGGTATILYTGGRGPVQLPCRATATDPDLRTWAKDPDNPVIDEAPEGVIGSEHWEAEFRDHCIWHADGLWHHLIGSGITDAGGAVFYYTSEDLREWEYVGPLLVGDGETGAMWECPELLDLGERDLLHVSNYEEVVYFLGELADGEFHPDERGLLDHGDFYAPQSLFEDDRSLTWGWLTEARDESAQWDAGWSGALSLPRELTYEDGHLHQRPAPELEGLRTAHTRREVDLETEARRLDVDGRHLELDATIHLGDAAEVEIAVLESPDGVERTPIRVTDGELVVERGDSSLDERVTATPQRMPLDGLERPLDLRAFVDGSVLELFVNERRCLTSRIYPTREDSVGVSLAAHEGSARVELDAWTLESIWAGEEARPVPDQ